VLLVLALPDPEHLRPALPTRALSCGFTVFHLDLLGTFDLHFLPALHAIRGHSDTSFCVEGHPVIKTSSNVRKFLNGSMTDGGKMILRS